MARSPRPVPAPPSRSGASDRPEIAIYVGGVHVSRDPAVVTTLVGSCIAACLVDPVAGVGGMSHFLLPSCAEADGDAPSRFGVHAMDLLIGKMQKAGAQRRRLTAKVFGGAHILPLLPHVGSVPARNIEFIESFLESEGIPIASQDVGGYLARRVLFHTDTGAAWVRRLGPSVVRRARREERAYGKILERSRHGDDVTLFDARGQAP